jgi:hypothetical protein
MQSFPIIHRSSSMLSGNAGVVLCGAGMTSKENVASARSRSENHGTGGGHVALASLPDLDAANLGSWATDPALMPGGLPGSRVQTSMQGASSPALSFSGPELPCCTTSRPAPLETSTEGGALPNGGSLVNGGQGSQKHIVIPDLSFMLSDTIVMPRQHEQFEPS